MTLELLLAISSILILTLLVWVVNKKLPIQICPICAGVTLTWLWMLFGMWFGLLDVSRYELLVAILMGASIGGIVTELKKIFTKIRNSGKSTDKAVELSEDKLKNCC